MFHPKYPRKAFVSRLIRLHVQFNRRLATVSIPRLSEESSKRPTSGGSSQINADRREADFNDVVTSSMGSENEQAAAKFTEEEMAIHAVHREACEAKKQMYVDPSSGYKVFTEYAHLQRGKCCGSACRHPEHMLRRSRVAAIHRVPFYRTMALAAEKERAVQFGAVTGQAPVTTS
ncbi:protein C1orf53 [Nibea albiflora]|uniref:Protein C1orf53 n=1 Tax=Nibea albiflora TaxID=240163 RepID=A0ACB7EM81_NIBAL|nr:protein C1orf53 [Nibea albiflora]